MRTIFTIGYEGANLDAFLATLSVAGVDHVFDVRDVPVSRKKGFSKTPLSAHLEAVGIRYTHFKPLGDPKEGRDAMRRGDHAAFIRIFEQHLATEEAQKALDEASVSAAESQAVLLCYERDPRHCHRSIVANCIVSRGDFSKVTHLGVRG